MRAVVLVALAGCPAPTPTSQTETTPTAETATQSSGDSGTKKTTGEPDLTVLAVQPVAAANTGHVATSQICETCHSNPDGTTALRDEADRPIAPFTLWQGSMMANAARDPLWRARVSAEMAAVPAASEAIAQKCVRCHAPLAATEALFDKAAAPTLDVLDGSDKELTALAIDGVSCTLCHQIEPTGFGEESSFTGGFSFSDDPVAFGPHAKPRTRPMEPMTGFLPAQGDHVLQSELCATCHTLRTHSLDLDGTPDGGEVLEQAPYLEWLASNHDEQGTSCQDCHLPTVSEDGVPIEATIAHAPRGMDFSDVEARSPVGRHLLVGGNTLVPQILDANRDLFQPLATSEAFAATVAAARDQLGTRTATLSLMKAGVTADELTFDVRVDNLAGHKFPTGIPLRRAWLHATIRDASGATVFESGAWDATGRLVDGSGTVLPSEEVGGPVLPHVTTVRSANAVPVYEAVLADKAGTPTWRLLAGAGYAKDNRLLPTGWDAGEAATLGVSPVGVEGDADFDGSGDVVAYAVDVTGRTGPFTVDVEMRFQTLSARAAAELFATGTPEALAFEVLWMGVEQTEIVGSASITVP